MSSGASHEHTDRFSKTSLLHSSVEKERGEKMPDSMIKVFLAGGGGGCSLAVVGQPLDTMYVFFFAH